MVSKIFSTLALIAGLAEFVLAINMFVTGELYNNIMTILLFILMMSIAIAAKTKKAHTNI